MYIPKEYSVYSKVVKDDGTSEWVGVHRLPIRPLLRTRRELRERGYRTLIRLSGELGPRHID